MFDGIKLAIKTAFLASNRSYRISYCVWNKALCHRLHFNDHLKLSQCLFACSLPPAAWIHHQEQILPSNFLFHSVRTFKWKVSLHYIPSFTVSHNILRVFLFLFNTGIQFIVKDNLQLRCSSMPAINLLNAVRNWVNSPKNWKSFAVNWAHVWAITIAWVHERKRNRKKSV